MVIRFDNRLYGDAKLYGKISDSLVVKRHLVPELLYSLGIGAVQRGESKVEAGGYAKSRLYLRHLPHAGRLLIHIVPQDQYLLRPCIDLFYRSRDRAHRVPAIERLTEQPFVLAHSGAEGISKRESDPAHTRAAFRSR